MTKRAGISRRVFIAFGGFTLLISLIYSCISIMVAYAVEDAVLAKILSLEADYIKSSFSATGKLAEPRVNYIRIYASSDQAPAVVSSILRKSPERREIFTDTGTHYHVQYVNLNENHRPLLVAEVTPLLIVSNMSVDILILLICALLTTLTLSLFLAYRISQRTIRPVKDLSSELMNQRMLDADIALSHVHSDREIAYLADTIEQSLNQLRQAVQRESDFNRDVSHELRTPLTVIKNVLTLSQSRNLTADEKTQLEDSAHKLDKILSTLLALARAESITRESFPLRPLMEDCILQLHDLSEKLDFPIELQLNDSFRVEANQQLLGLLISNLLNNAMQHASKPGLSIRLENNQIRFENQVDTAPADNITIAGVKQSASSGMGQGLYLVSRIVDALNWQYEIASTEDRYCFILIPTLPGQLEK
ncbi:MAG: hypothetical protein GKR93_01545 [Gammaproteobacteria bacterium]|nr:hypothetical protein [Gammaproteobacteria bacterium]